MILSDSPIIITEQQPAVSNVTPQNPVEDSPLDTFFKPYADEDGELDRQRLYEAYQNKANEAQAEKIRAEGFRKKMSEPKSHKPFDVKDLGMEFDQDDIGEVGEFVGILNEAKVDKDTASKLLTSLVSKYGESDPEAELAKLGEERPVIMGKLQDFSKTMRSSNLWTDDQVKQFDEYVDTADKARFFSGMLENIRNYYAGNFSSRGAQGGTTDRGSEQANRSYAVDRYMEAHAVAKTDPARGKAMLRALDREYGVQ